MQPEKSDISPLKITETIQQRLINVVASLIMKKQAESTTAIKRLHREHGASKKGVKQRLEAVLAARWHWNIPKYII